MKIPNCFKNLVGIRDDCDVLPTTGLYLDDLIDLSLQTLSDISGSTGKEMFNSIYKRSMIELLSELEDTIDSILKVQLNNVISIENIGYRNSIYNPQANINRGIFVQKNRSSNMKRIYIGTVGLLTDNTESVVVSIIDGDEIISKTIDTYPGRIVNKVFDYSCNSDFIYIVSNNNNINTCFSTVKPPELLNTPCCGGCNYTYNKLLNIAGYDGNSYVNNTFGLFADINLYCDKTYLYCALVDDIGLPLLYKIAHNVALAAIQSQRINSNVNIDFWQPLGEMYLQKYEYYLKAAISRSEKVVKNIDPQCIVCRGNKIINTHF